MGAAAKRIRGRADAVRDIREKTTLASGKQLGASLRRRVKADTGGDSRLSGLGPKAGKVGVTVKSERGARTTVVHVDASPKKMRGPWDWLNRGVDAGTRRNRTRTIESFNDSIGRSRKRRAKGGTYQHPGQPAKRTFDDPVDTELPKIRAEFRAEFRSAIRRGA